MAADAIGAVRMLLPTLTIQNDYPSVYADIVSSLHSVEDIWCSAYHSTSAGAAKSCHGKIRVIECEGEGGRLANGVQLVGRDGIVVEQSTDNQNTLMVACPSLSIPETKLLFPISNSTVFDAKSSQGGGTAITCVALSSAGDRFAVGGMKGKVWIGRREELSERGRWKEARGSAGDVNALKFTANDRFILAACCDMTVRVFSALDGKLLLTLSSHSRSVTSLSLIASSPSTTSFISASLDCSMKIWEINEDATQFRLLNTIPFDHPITSLSIIYNPGDDTSMTDEAASGEDDRVILGYSNGNGTIIHLSSLLSTPITLTAPPYLFSSAGITSLASTRSQTSKETLLATGNSMGEIYLFTIPSSVSTNHATKPEELKTLVVCSRSSMTAKAPITSLSFSQQASSSASASLIVGTADGLPYRAVIHYSYNLAGALEIENVTVGNEFAGLDCDTAFGLCVPVGNEEEVWIGGGDGILRRYKE